MRRLRNIEQQIRLLQTARRLESASIGAGGLRVRGGRIVIENDAGEETFVAATDGLTLQGLLQVLGSIAILDGGSLTVAGGHVIVLNDDGDEILSAGPDGLALKGSLDVDSGDDINVGSGGSVIVADGGRFETRYPDESISVGLGTLFDSGGSNVAHGLVVQDNEAGSSLDIFAAYRSISDGNKYVFIGQGSDNPIDDFGVRSQTLAIEATNGIARLLASEDIFLNADDFIGLTGGGQINIDSGADQVFISHTTTGSAANAFLQTGGLLQRSTSARRYKRDIADLVVDPASVLQLRPRTWRDKAEVDAEPDTDRWHVGLVAEEVEAAGLSAFVEYTADGNPDYVAYDRLSVALLGLARTQEDRLAALEARMSALDGANVELPSIESTPVPKRCERPTPAKEVGSV